MDQPQGTRRPGSRLTHQLFQTSPEISALMSDEQGSAENVLLGDFSCFIYGTRKQLHCIYIKLRYFNVLNDYLQRHGLLSLHQEPCFMWHSRSSLSTLDFFSLLLRFIDVRYPLIPRKKRDTQPNTTMCESEGYSQGGGGLGLGLTPQLLSPCLYSNTWVY